MSGFGLNDLYFRVKSSGGGGVSNPGGLAEGRNSYVQSQLQDGYASTDYYTLTRETFFGNNFRFTGKTGGYYDGSGYYDLDGTPSTKASAFPDTMVLIHDMTGKYNETNKYVLCMYAVPTSSKTYTAHISDSNSLVYGGIGPNRWFLAPIEWYFYLADNNTSSQYYLNHAPFDSIGTNDLIWTVTDQASPSSYRLSYRQRYNHDLPRAVTSSYRSLYWCWYDLEND